MPGVFNLLSSRANLHLSYNPAGSSHCKLQNHQGHIKHHHRDMGGSPGDAREELWPFSKLSVTSPTSQLILQSLRRFTYVTSYSPILLLLHLHHSSFSNPSFASPTSQAELILQPFHHFTYITAHSPILLSLYLRHSSFSNPSFTSLMSQALHLCHLASRPCW